MPGATGALGCAGRVRAPDPIGELSSGMHRKGQGRNSNPSSVGTLPRTRGCPERCPGQISPTLRQRLGLRHGRPRDSGRPRPSRPARPKTPGAHPACTSAVALTSDLARPRATRCPASQRRPLALRPGGTLTSFRSCMRRASTATGGDLCRVDASFAAVHINLR